MPMNPEYKTEWLKALRSGEYNQCKERLRLVDHDANEVSFCCLGVLSDIYAKKNNILWNNFYYKGEYEMKPLSEYDYLPEEFTDELGIDKRGSIAGREINNVYVTSLAECNDEAKLSFAEIADIIEREL